MSSSKSFPRVASLLPSTTEIVAAMGAADLLVGVSHECDWPPQIAQRVLSGELPVLTSARLGPPGLLGPAGAGTLSGSQPPESLSMVDVTGAALLPEPGESQSAAIDRRLHELVSEALSVYIVDEQALAASAPSVVLTQDLCEVCAVSYEETCRAVSFLQGEDVQVLSTHPSSLKEIWGDILNIGEAIGRTEDARKLLQELRVRTADVAGRASDAGHKPRVLTLEWIDPPMPGGLWMGELVELAGGIPIGDQRGAKTHAMSREMLEALSPEVLVVKPCGFSLEQALGELAALQRAVPWASWPACREGRVYICDGSAYFNRPGPRIADSLELLAACVHPELFADFATKYAGAYRRV